MVINGSPLYCFSRSKHIQRERFLAIIADGSVAVTMIFPNARYGRAAEIQALQSIYGKSGETGRVVFCDKNRGQWCVPDDADAYQECFDGKTDKAKFWRRLLDDTVHGDAFNTLSRVCWEEMRGQHRKVVFWGDLCGILRGDDRYVLGSCFERGLSEAILTFKDEVRGHTSALFDEDWAAKHAAEIIACYNDKACGRGEITSLHLRGLSSDHRFLKQWLDYRRRLIEEAGSL